VSALTLVAVTCIGVVAMAGSALAAQPHGLNGEHLAATADGSSYFVPGSCYSGGSATASFSFKGSATGPFPGTYTETGALRYSLATVTFGQEIATGPVTGFSATVTITSAAGTVVVVERFDRALSADQDGHCYESAGGTSFATDALRPTYTAKIVTGRGIFRDHGSVSEALASEVGLGGSVSDSSETADLTSTAPTRHRAKGVSAPRQRGGTRRERHRRGSQRKNHRLA
jgi:hypothetical protein